MDFYTTTNDFAEQKDSYIQVCTDEIKIFNPEQQLSLTYRGFNIQNAVNVHERYLYITADLSNNTSIQLHDSETGESTVIPLKQKEGLYVITVKALFNGTIERYKISMYGTGGCSSLIEYNSNKGRLALMEDYDTIVVMSEPQLNTVNFIGMGNKHEYLMWRDKHGFFTALNRKGELSTWSILTGKILYSLKMDDDASGEILDNYEIYKSNANDITYTRRAYNFDEYSLTLLKSMKPVTAYSDAEIQKLIPQSKLVKELHQLI